MAGSTDAAVSPVATSSTGTCAQPKLACNDALLVVSPYSHCPLNELSPLYALNDQPQGALQFWTQVFCKHKSIVTVLVIDEVIDVAVVIVVLVTVLEV